MDQRHRRLQAHPTSMSDSKNDYTGYGSGLIDPSQQQQAQQQFNQYNYQPQYYGQPQHGLYLDFAGNNRLGNPYMAQNAYPYAGHGMSSYPNGGFISSNRPCLPNLPSNGSSHSHTTYNDFLSPPGQTVMGDLGGHHLPTELRMGSSSQSAAAANFFARNSSNAANNNNNNSHGQSALMMLSKSKLARAANDSDDEDKQVHLKTNFRAIICRAPPCPPSSLLAKIENGMDGCDRGGGLGKVKVVVRVAAAKEALNGDVDGAGETNGNREECLQADNVLPCKFFNMDRKRRQITLMDPAVIRTGNNGLPTEIGIEERKIGVAAPKIFAYDGLFTSDDAQEDVAASTLTDIITAVIVGGSDGCLFCFGHRQLGKTYTMIGEDVSKNTVGVLPTGVAWLYRAIKERKQRTNTRFSVRVSAAEIYQSPTGEEMRDLLTQYATEGDDSPGIYLRSAAQGSALQNLVELRASSVEKAAYYLDAALSKRSLNTKTGSGSHFLFTLHIYQHSSNGDGGAGGRPTRVGGGSCGSLAGATSGRSRLHLFDFGACDRTPQQSSSLHGGGGTSITLSGLGNVILGIFNSQKHLPCRQSKVTAVLKECLGSPSCHAAMLAHVSPEPSHYSETLHTLQLASRIHRMRRKRARGVGRGSSSSDDGRRASSRSSSSGTSSEFTATSTDPSSSELSCATVVYRGSSDGSGTDGEHPPPPLNMESHTARFRRRHHHSGGSKILTNGAISPSGRLSLSPQPYFSSAFTPPSSLSPSSSGHFLPFSHGLSNQSSSSPSCSSPKRLTPTLPTIKEVGLGKAGHKMPLNGCVPGYRQPAEIWIDGEKERQQLKQKALQEHGLKANSLNQQHQQPQFYGYMDDFKANMITHWVENQKARDMEGVGDRDLRTGALFLTQFKQVDSSDSGSDQVQANQQHQQQAAVEVHSGFDGVPDQPDQSRGNPTSVFDSCQQARKVKSKPPPPPPRTTALLVKAEAMVKPQRQEEPPIKLSPRGETEGSDCSTEPLPEPNFDELESCVVEGPKFAGLINQTASPHDLCMKNLMELERELSNPFPHLLSDKGSDSGSVDNHPLRILSEENLTVVSTFVGDGLDLEQNIDDEEVETASQLSFFRVPDYYLAKSQQHDAGARAQSEEQDDAYFTRRLQELSQLTLGDKKPTTGQPAVKSEGPAALAQEGNSKAGVVNNCDISTRGFELYQSHSVITGSQPNSRTNQCLSEPSAKVNDREKIRPQEKSSAVNNRLDDVTVNAAAAAPAPLTPQKQFQLLAQTLVRRPDGSSNPDIDRAVSGVQHHHQQPTPLLHPPAKRSPGSGQSSSDQDEELDDRLGKSKEAGLCQEEVQKSHFVKRQDESSYNHPKDDLLEEGRGKKKEGSQIGMFLQRIFGSTRSKSKLDKRKKSELGSQATPKSSHHALDPYEEKKRSKSCDRELDARDSEVKIRARSQKHNLLRHSAKSAHSSPFRLPALGSEIEVDTKGRRQSGKDPKKDQGRQMSFPHGWPASPWAQNGAQDTMRSETTVDSLPAATPTSMLSLDPTEWEFQCLDEAPGSLGKQGQGQRRDNDANLDESDEIHGGGLDIINNDNYLLETYAAGRDGYSSDQGINYYTTLRSFYGMACDGNSNPFYNINSGQQLRGHMRASSDERDEEERKSSGYDSLEGENSSLGSTSSANAVNINNNNNNLNIAVTGNNNSPHVAAKLEAGAEEDEDEVSEDEVAKLKMEISRHPDILNCNY